MNRIIILLILMTCLGTGYAQTIDSAVQDTAAVKTIEPAKAAVKSDSTTDKSNSHKIRKADTTVKKDTAATTDNQSEATRRQPAVRKKTDSTAVSGADNQMSRPNQSHLDSSKPVMTASGSAGGGKASNTASNSAEGAAQTAPSTPVKKTKPNPLPKKMAAAAIAKGNAELDLSIYLPKNMNGAFGTTSLGVVQLHSGQNKDYLFYSFLAITLLLALTKISYPKYFNQIFWFFLHPNDRKKNISDPINGRHIIPSILLNLFFALTGGLFLTQIFHPVWTGGNFWKNWAIFSLVLVIVYLVKFLIIKLSGWLFNSPVAAGTYNNVVFSINKIIGLFLLPITLLIAYGGSQSIRSAISAATIVISILLIYRYIASFLLIKGKLRVNALHFILYLCAVEIIPLLLAYKVLFSNIDQLI